MNILSTWWAGQLTHIYISFFAFATCERHLLCVSRDSTCLNIMIIYKFICNRNERKKKKIECEFEQSRWIHVLSCLQVEKIHVQKKEKEMIIIIVNSTYLIAFCDDHNWSGRSSRMPNSYYISLWQRLSKRDLLLSGRRKKTGEFFDSMYTIIAFQHKNEVERCMRWQYSSR